MTERLLRMGGNDELFGIEPEESIDNIEKIINKFTNSGIGVCWATSLPALENKISPNPSLHGGQALTRGEQKNKNQRYEPYAEETMKIKTNAGVELINMFEIYQQYDLSKFFTFVSEENVVEGIKAGEIDTQHPNQLGNAYVAKIFLEKIFGINFDPEKYIEETLKGDKLPGY